MKKEEPKRLTPTNETIRELYLKSGNQCAMPNCKNLIMNNDGTLIGQLCHIEAALTKGERFNENQTNEERRAFTNLILLCYPCHKITNDIDNFPVEKLIQIKSEHESKFSNIVFKIKKSIKDNSSLNILEYPENLLRLNSVLKWGHTSKELNESLKELKKFIENLNNVPVSTRQLLTVIANRVNITSVGLEFSSHEIEEACELSEKELRKHIGILDRLGFVTEGTQDEFGNINGRLHGLESGWPIWSDIIEFSKKADVNISEFIEKLNFNLFDN